jgi:hypothetical protein
MLLHSFGLLQEIRLHNSYILPLVVSFVFVQVWEVGAVLFNTRLSSLFLLVATMSGRTKDNRHIDLQAIAPLKIIF